MEAPRRDAHPPGHGPVQAVPEAEPRRAQVVLAGAALHALAANPRGRLADDAVSLAEGADPGARARDSAAELVTEHHRHVHAPGVRVVRLVDIGPADRYAPDLQEDIPLADLRDGKLAKLHGVRLKGVMDDGGMRLHCQED